MSNDSIVLHANLLSCERKYFFAETLYQKTDALLEKGDFYFKSKLYHSALLTFERIPFESIESDSLAIIILYKKTLNAYLSAQFEKVEVFSSQYFMFFSDSVYRQKMLLLKVFALNEQQRWDEAFSILEQQLPKDDIAQNKFNALKIKYLHKNQPKLRNKFISSKYGIFVPGGPYFYNGFVGDGLINVGLEAAGLGIAAFYALFAHQYLTSVVIGLGTFNRFYIGAQRKSNFLVEKRNYINSKSYNESLRKEIADFLITTP